MRQESILSIQELLEPYREELGEDYNAYLNHCIRVSHFCIAFEKGTLSIEKINIASAFHDLGIWTNNTFDYLKPSEDLACAYLRSIGKDDWIPEIVSMIENHHKITSYSANITWLTEIFRKADWIDVSLGRLRFGLSRKLIKDVRSIPNVGFHKKLTILTLKRIVSRPFNPLPMFRI